MSATMKKSRVRDHARQARKHLLFTLPLLIAVTVFYHYRHEIMGHANVPVRLLTAFLFLILGWEVALDAGRALRPIMDRYLEPVKAELVSFLVRLTALVAAILTALSLAGLSPRALVVGASLTGIILGLAAQQTLGNLIAGIVLLSARPFNIGDRVRFNGFGMDVEGTVAARGLLYITCTDGDDLVMVPNTTALTMSVRPIREPIAVDMLARLPHGIDPEAVEMTVEQTVTVPTKGRVHITLEEYTREEVLMRIKAIPVDDSEGALLAREVLEAISKFEEHPPEHFSPEALGITRSERRRDKIESHPSA